MLSITPIYFSGIKTLPQTKNIKKFSNTKDSFEKNINFKGNINNGFEYWIKSNNFDLNTIKDIVLNEKYLLGSGNDHSAYIIPNCKDYVIRITTVDKDFLSNADYKKAKISYLEDNLDINIGQKVGKIEVDNEENLPIIIEVLKRQLGNPVGVQRSETLYIADTDKLRKGMLPYEDISRKQHFAKTIDKLAKLPTEAYENFIDEFNKAHEKGYLFDYLNSNNLLVDSENKKINLIDMKHIKNNEKIKPNYASALYALTNIEYYSTYTSPYGNYITNEEERTKAMEDIATIITKFCQAMKNKKAKINIDEVPIEFRSIFMHAIPCLYAFETFSVEGIEKAMKEIDILE